RLTEVEAVLNGDQMSDKLIAAASAKARQSVDPPTDIHAPGAYRAALVATLLGRGLKKSAA
ncbi:MAG TPA: xanthine dehydrogenase family protein subunit M, partial [Bradyrhizobium sp.]|nr:xanthine dehydrogenase family protein subunit M [Bradyrhizobium sp.]